MVKFTQPGRSQSETRMSKTCGIKSREIKAFGIKGLGVNGREIKAFGIKGLGVNGLGVKALGVKGG
jgi:hypothetical protein